MMLSLYQFWIIVAEAIGVMVVEKKWLPVYIAVVMVTITMFFFFPVRW